MTGFSTRLGRISADSHRETHFKRFGYLALLLGVALLTMIVGLMVLDAVADQYLLG